MKKTIFLSVLSMLIVLFLSSMLVAEEAFVPHPLGEYDLAEYDGLWEEIEEEVRDIYSVNINAPEGDDVYPWKSYSFATLWSREMAEAWACRRVVSSSMVAGEAEEFVDQHLALLDDYIVIQLYLRSDVKEGYRYTQVVNFKPDEKSFEPLVDRIILSFDDGRIAEAKERRPGGSTVDGGTWRTFNTVYFPAEDDSGRSYMTEDTEWIRLWLQADDCLVYFHFDFMDK